MTHDPHAAARHAGPDEAAHARHAHACRDRAPRAPGPSWHTARALLRYGTTPGRGLHGRGAQLPGRAGGDRRARHAQLQGGRRAHERARARARRPTAIERGRRRRDHVPQPPRLDRRRRWRARKLGANALFLNTAFSGPQLTDVAKREKPKAVVYDQEFAEVLKDAGARRKRYVAWQPTARSSDPPLEDADRARRHASLAGRRRPSRAARSSSPRARPARPRAPRARCRSRSTRSPRCCR